MLRLELVQMVIFFNLFPDVERFIQLVLFTIYHDLLLGPPKHKQSLNRDNAYICQTVGYFLLISDSEREIHEIPFSICYI